MGGSHWLHLTNIKNKEKQILCVCAFIDRRFAMCTSSCCCYCFVFPFAYQKNAHIPLTYDELLVNMFTVSSS